MRYRSHSLRFDGRLKAPLLFVIRSEGLILFEAVTFPAFETFFQPHLLPSAVYRSTQGPFTNAADRFCTSALLLFYSSGLVSLIEAMLLLLLM
jgi:hypothetical protein